MSTAVAPSITSLTLVRTINAPRERVFAAWTDPALMQQWFSPTEDYAVTATNDLRRGGDYTIEMAHKGGNCHTTTGKYMEIVPPERLVFTWTSVQRKELADNSIITIQLRDLGGKTELTLTHTQLPTAASVEQHTQGWRGCLNRLALFADPNADIAAYNAPVPACAS